MAHSEGVGEAMTIGDAIRIALEGRLKQRELADALGIDQGTVSRWVTGKATPTVEDVVRIEDACNRPRGFVLRAAGYISDGTTVLDAIEADHRLDDDARRILSGAYKAARARR